LRHISICSCQNLKGLEENSNSQQWQLELDSLHYHLFYLFYFFSSFSSSLPPFPFLLFLLPFLYLLLSCFVTTPCRKLWKTQLRWAIPCSLCCAQTPTKEDHTRGPIVGKGFSCTQTKGLPLMCVCVCNFQTLGIRPCLGSTPKVHEKHVQKYQNY